MYNPYLAKTIIAIQNRLGERVTLPPISRRIASLEAQLFHAATVGKDQDAREQLRILSAITPEAHTDFLRGL